MPTLRDDPNSVRPAGYAGTQETAHEMMDEAISCKTHSALPEATHADAAVYPHCLTDLWDNPINIPSTVVLAGVGGGGVGGGVILV